MNEFTETIITKACIDIIHTNALKGTVSWFSICALIKMLFSGGTSCIIYVGYMIMS